MLIIRDREGQSMIEYFVMFSIVMLLIFSTGIIDKVKGAFAGYFNAASSRIITSSVGAR